MTRDRRQEPVRLRFRRALTLLAMTLVAPGSAQYVAGNRLVGRVALRIALGVVCVGVLAGLIGLVSPKTLIGIVANDQLLVILRSVLLTLAIGWLALFIDAWRLGRPLDLPQRQRLTASVLTGVLACVTTGALVLSSQYVASAHNALTTVFTGKASVEPFAGRYNIMLLGTDGGEDRVGLRPDSITIASIDEETGATALISLPRNLQKVPFAQGSVPAKQFPNGFDCGSECLLNAVYTWGNDNAELFGSDVDDPGMAAMKAAVEGITGLPINYHVLVDMNGFIELVDALGGITVTVGERLPIGGVGSEIRGYIEPGRQVLNGHDAMWFTRSRAHSSDYDRMARQRCVLAAMRDQLDPSTLLLRFQEIAAAGEQLVTTSIPPGELNAFVDLAWKARKLPITTVQFVPPLIVTADPDFQLIRTKVRETVRASDAAVAGDPGGAEPSGSTGDDGSGGGSAESSGATGEPAADGDDGSAPGDQTGGGSGAEDGASGGASGGDSGGDSQPGTDDAAGTEADSAPQAPSSDEPRPVGELTDVCSAG